MNGHMHILGQIKNVENKPINYVKVSSDILRPEQQIPRKRVQLRPIQQLSIQMRCQPLTLLLLTPTSGK